MQNNYNINLLVAQLGSDRIKEKIEGFDFFYIATTTRELIRSVKLCRELKIPFMVHGLASKIILPDEGFRGLGIKNRSSNLKIFGVKGKISRNGIGVEEALIEADSGVTLNGLALFVRKQGLGGFESLEIEKGTLGGSLRGHQLMNETANQVKVLDYQNEQKVRTSLEIKDDDTVLSVIFKLKARKYA